MYGSKPIGFWLKHLHNLLEEHFDVVLADLSLSRRHWQVLSTLSQGASNRASLCTALTPFWDDIEQDLGEVLDGTDGLITLGWVAQRPSCDTLTLTENGRAAHADLASRIEQTRAVVTTGLTKQQYAETVQNLATMSRNVETALAGYAR